jgi:hypothetical protein
MWGRFSTIAKTHKLRFSHVRYETRVEPRGAWGDTAVEAAYLIDGNKMAGVVTLDFWRSDYRDRLELYSCPIANTYAELSYAVRSIIRSQHTVFSPL